MTDGTLMADLIDGLGFVSTLDNLADRATRFDPVLPLTWHH